MRVVHILNELRPSGAEAMLHMSAPGWRSGGCELHILAICDDPGPYAETLKAAGWNIRTTGDAATKLQKLMRTRRILNELAPDLVHIHPESMSLGFASVAKSLRIPALRTVHNVFLFEGFLRWRKTLERGAARMLGTRQIAISESVQRNESERFSNPTQLCWNWIDTERFRPPSATERREAREKLHLPADRSILVSVGNGSDVKNYRAIIEAMAELRDPSLLYCQVGHAHPLNLDEQLAGELGISHQVRFCGPSHEILQWLWAADVFVMPSIYEGFGLAAVEALAAGCECIFADCPGLCDFKEFEIEAIWTEADGKAMAHALRQAISTPIPPDRRIDNSQRVRNLFSCSTRAAAYFTVWKDVIASQSYQREHSQQQTSEE